MRLPIALATAVVVWCTTASPAVAAAKPWPLPRLELGLSDQPGGATELARGPRLKLRYQYLAGGVNTAHPWTDWGPRFVEDYVAESRTAGVIPVFTYYEIRQSLPGGSSGDEPAAVLDNLRSRSTMRAYLENLRELYVRLGQAGGTTVVHLEPDMWGYLQQRYGDDAGAAPVIVGSSGVEDLAGLPDTAAGLAQAALRLRDRYAPSVLLGYHVSIWGTGKDIVISNERGAAVDALADRAASFYRSLGADFDAVFGEFSDRTSGFAVAQGTPRATAWWTAADFTRHARFFRRVHEATARPIVLWQIPLGNDRMRTVDNTTGHFQDNRVPWLLSAAGRYRHLRTYRDAGVVALLFGSGQGGDTTTSDAQGDGTTNPAPINGNRRRAARADDDGGYFRERARAYRKRGPLTLAP